MQQEPRKVIEASAAKYEVEVRGDDHLSEGPEEVSVFANRVCLVCTN